MLTVRHIERLWNSGKHARLLDELLAQRIESLTAKDLVGPDCKPAAAAMALIRLDELNQPHAAICPKLIRSILANQDADGGWGEVMTTALCLRALSLQQGDGAAIQRGLAYLADLQQPAGAWPRIPFRRMATDALASALVMLELGDNELFRESVRFSDAVDWFIHSDLSDDPPAAKLWNSARVRCAPPSVLFSHEAIWS